MRKWPIKLAKLHSAGLTVVKAAKRDVKEVLSGGEWASIHHYLCLDTIKQPVRENLFSIMELCLLLRNKYRKEHPGTFFCPGHRSAPQMKSWQCDSEWTTCAAKLGLQMDRKTHGQKNEMRPRRRRRDAVDIMESRAKKSRRS